MNPGDRAKSRNVAALDNTTEVETPERIRFRHRTAGPVRRSLAWLVDFLIRAGVLLLVLLGLRLGLARRLDADEIGRASQGVVLVVMFALEWGYYVLFETLWNGGSPGKRLLGLRVVKEGGFPIGFLDSVLRNLLRAADFLPMGYVVGATVMAADARFRRLGDRVAGTMVIVEDRVRVSEPLRLVPPATPAEWQGWPSRVVLSATEREALELFLRRRDLSVARRQELAAMVAPLWARRMGVAAGDPARFLALLHERGAATPAERR
jgi:uncharacterized RDD family membrane protein YckC